MRIERCVPADQLIVHDEEDTASFCCSVCFKIFNNQKAFHVHKSSHTEHGAAAGTEETSNEDGCSPANEQPAQHCSTDDSSYAKPPDGIHGGFHQTGRLHHRRRYMAAPSVTSRPYRCGVCFKRFLQPHHLKRHVFIHTGHKPFPCTLCGKRFQRKDHLRKHSESCIRRAVSNIYQT